MIPIYDVIVCGGGVQGLWTANHLAEKCKNVLLIEQFPSFHTRGSSHGPSRITRYSYATSHHTKMMVESFDLWNKLEQSQKTSLFINCGLLSLLDENNANKIVGSINGINKNCDKLTSDQVNCKFSSNILSHGLVGVYESSAGVLKASKCLMALQKNFVEHGGVLHDVEKVNFIHPISNDLVEVHTNKQIYCSKSIVLTCGAWINKLLQPLHLHIPVKVFRVSVEYWKAHIPYHYDSSHFPAVIISNPAYGHDVYSTPIWEYPGMMKVCLHEGVEITVDETKNYDQVKENSHRNLLKSVVTKHYPNLIPECVVQETCIYSKTPDCDFILDHHPRHRNIIIGAGFSGHGFKLSPVVGKILADLAIGKISDYPLDHFSLKRFSKISKL